MKLLTSTILAAGVAAAALALPTASVAEYPEKPVSFVVPWPPGDLEDVLTRMIAEDFQAKYGVAAAVVNKPGGGGGPFPGAIEVASCTSRWLHNWIVHRCYSSGWPKHWNSRTGTKPV